MVGAVMMIVVGRSVVFDPFDSRIAQTDQTIVLRSSYYSRHYTSCSDNRPATTSFNQAIGDWDTRNVRHMSKLLMRATS